MVWGAEITRYTGRGRQRSATLDDGSVVLLIRLAPHLQVPPLDEPTILLTWYDCSADEPEDYSDKLTGLDVLFTENMTAVPVIAGRTTFPLGRNLTVKVTTERQTPTAPGTKFNSGAGNFPFGVTGNLCDPTYVALPFGLGDV